MSNGWDFGQPDQYPQQGWGRQWPQEQRGPQDQQPRPAPQGEPWQPGQYDPRQHQRRMGYQQSEPPRRQQGYGQPPFQPAPKPTYRVPQGRGYQHSTPQGQPWPQPGYQPPQGPPGWQQPGYGQQPPRRKRHTVRNFLAPLGGFIVVVIVIIIVVANSGGHTVQTAGSTTTGIGKSAGKSVPAKAAGIGSAITLSGNDSGEQMSVTVTKVITDAQPGDEISGAPSGDRLYAVQFRLRDTGSAAYSDAPSNGAAVVDSSGQSYQSALDNAASCQSFPGSENIASGASGLGCIVFEVPEAAKITKVQFTLDSGMGPQTGQWNVG
jgi:Domain of unknown function (DUF4352)